jgi:trans-aconitate methyltransferase
MSMRMLAALGVTVDDAIVDVGGGAGWLASGLVERGYRDVTVVEWSAVALGLARARCGGMGVELAQADVLSWRPRRGYDVWHDRAVFHFVTLPKQLKQYRETLGVTLRPGGAAVIAAFANDGPPSCSGLPVQRYSPAELIDALGPGMVVVAHERERHVTPRGGVQWFTWVAMRWTG